MFVQLKEYPDYLVTTSGKIISTKRGVWKEMRTSSMVNGYLKVHLRQGGRSVWKLVHRLVAEAFLGCTECVINHIDFNRQNNCIENLECVSQQQNIAHSRAAGKYLALDEKSRGESNPHSKLTGAKVQEILALKNIVSGRELGRRYGVSAETIRSILMGRAWKHIPRG